MIQDEQVYRKVLRVQEIRTPLVPIHIKLCKAGLFEHDHEVCDVCAVDDTGCEQVQVDLQSLIDQGVLSVEKKKEEVCVIIPEFHIPKKLEVEVKKSEAVSPLIICLPGPVPSSSQKAVPYRYNATMVQDGKEVPIPTAVSNIADSSRVLRSGRIFPTVVPPVKANIPTAVVQDKEKEKVVEQPAVETSKDDEVLKLIKRSEYRIVDQLLQTPSKISIMNLLMNSDAHREALMKVLGQAYVEQDVTVGQFGSIIGNVTACNNLSFSDEDLPEGGKDHNLALHISVNCGSDTLSNVLVDTGSSLNVMAKSTLDKLSYRGAVVRPSSMIVKAFDGSRKSVMGEVDLPILVGPHEFIITFQIMDIQAAYSCLLGRPWIHEAGAVTSTLHQKLKFIKNGKLVTVSGEEALLVSHLSSFSHIGGNDDLSTAFQGLSIEGRAGKKTETVMASLNDAKRIVKEDIPGWGQVIQLPENKNREGLGFVPSAKEARSAGPSKTVFKSAGFIHTKADVNAIIEDEEEEVFPCFVTPNNICNNWVAVDVPSVTPLSK